jgi:transposase-like protein
MTFKNLQQLFDTFKDEATCREYLEQQRWNGNVECPFCGCTKVYRTNRGFKCADKFCAKKFTVTVGTIYENSKVGLRTFFAALYLISSSKKGISSLQLSRQLGITQKSAWFVLHRIREMLKDKSTQKLSGTVEIDETYVGGLNGNRRQSKKLKNATGRSLKDKAPVVGIVERNGNVRAYSVPNMQRAVVHSIIYDNVEKGSTMVTDEFPIYVTLKTDYNHQVIQHRLKQYVRGEIHTNTIEGFWGILKRGIIGIYHQVSTKHLQRYCDEFSARYNTRQIKDNERFELAVKNSEGRLTYNQLIQK